MNYSQYFLEHYKILVNGLGTNLKIIFKSLYICQKEKWKEKFWGHPRGVREPPKNRGFGYFPLWVTCPLIVQLSHLIFFLPIDIGTETLKIVWFAFQLQPQKSERVFLDIDYDLL